ncbi:hypothetical protein LOTGIDRAFT_167700 [Lottia gigantea]|uniref:Regulator of G-protein signaling 3 n=1 Tax=Lottia gigantea TaxID=225164 RepID=V3ZTS0_LOTGI|nr:hypothetical protein LOTGIDRAFT_167700 [Lottia gigantea]ESO85945.1 hypothetical protein LOTGIDRAFT_167700 [Lottia gigantea]
MVIDLSESTRKKYTTSGQLKVSAYMNFGLLTVHVVQGRNFSSSWKPLCDSYIKMSLVPDESKRTRCKTASILNTNNPLFDDKFSFEILEEDHNKRLLISVWHKDQKSGLSEFLGCMSFGVKHLMNPKKEVNGWYYLLTEEIGRKKHLQITKTQKPALKTNTQSNIPQINKDVKGSEPTTVMMYRGKNGFGFSVVESFPVKVGRVDGASPAEEAGLIQGDTIVKVNGQNVSRSTAVSVAKLVKRSSNKLVLDVQRITENSTNNTYEKPIRHNNSPEPIYESINSYASYPSQDLDSTDGDISREMIRDSEISVDTDNAFLDDPEEFMPTSTPLPLLCNGHRTVTSVNEQRKQEAVHRLLSLELDFIDFMHAGVQRYSRPLRHCILAAQQHSSLFQNVEKLVTISEYHVKQMQDNSPSFYSDADDTQSSDGHFFHVMGLIYQSKLHMLCQAYEIYANGLSNANAVLSDLKRNPDFVRFVKEPVLTQGVPSISAFIYRPIQHLKELQQCLQDIFNNTSTDSEDFITLKNVVEGLQESVNNMTNCSTRVHSLNSLSSKRSKGSAGSLGSSGSSSGSGSMKYGSSSSGSSSSNKVPNSCSMQTVRSVDAEVMKIQDRLVFDTNIPVFQLCQEERHLIYRGDTFKWEGQQWVKIHMLLFSDVLLQVEKDRSGFMKVIEEPLFLREICGVEANRKHATEFLLHTCPRSPCTGLPAPRRLVFCASTTEEKCVWKNLLEQRVHNIRGTITQYSSTSSDNSISSVIV